MIFMGERFDSLEQLRRFYPAYCGNDALRAIRDGAETPHEVEVHVYRHSAAFKRTQLAAARANGKKLVQPTVAQAVKAQARRARGGAATAKRRKAA